MAQYNGYRVVPHNTYDAFKNATINSGWNVDYSFGNQCWDLCSLCYWQYGDTLYTGPQSRAKECWTVSKNRNQQTPFIAVEGKSNIKRGDIIVLNGTSQYPTGHICFADEDYNGTNTLRTFGQTPSKHGINGNASVDNLSISLFLGIFRNTQWQAPVPPTPSGTTRKKSKFPWVIAWNNWDGFKH
jgi:hypothetical protein